ncbi:glutathione S-transferase family protein [Glaciecola sp. 1036]|uniref:glutathione S-transferase family protein n=1 Tax=Alteromonadaceae TaxID=72275 RepID=UPI003D076EFE
MLTIYSHPGSRGFRCVWAAEELELPYEFKLVNLYKGEHKAPEYKAITPTGKVPCISVDGVTIAESGAILSFLGDKSGKLIPVAGSALRAKFEEMMYFVMTELEQPLWLIGKHSFALPEDKRIEQNKALGAWEFQRALKVFSKMLGENDYAISDVFSLADVAAGHTLAWAKAFELEIAPDNVKAYLERVTSREAYKKARQVEKDVKIAAGL